MWQSESFRLGLGEAGDRTLASAGGLEVDHQIDAAAPAPRRPGAA